MNEALNVLMRWLHITSLVVLIGGIVYARAVAAPAFETLARDARSALEEALAARYRFLVFAAISGLVVSGLYNILSNPGHTPRYHMILGIKLLLVLHVFAVAILVVRPRNERRTRMMTGTMISGLVVILLSAYLRRIF